MIHSAATVPNSASTAPKTMASGSRNERNSTSSTVKTRTMAIPSTMRRFRKDSCLLLVEPAELDGARRQCGIVRQQALDLLHGTAQVAAFEPRRDGHVLPQVLAPELQLSGLLGHVGDLCQRHHPAVGRADRQGRQSRHPVEPPGIDLDPDRDEAVTLEHARGRLAEHGGIHGRADVGGGEAEPLGVHRAHAKGEGRAGVHEPVEGIDDSLHLLDRFLDPGRLALEEVRCRSRTT